LRVLFTCAAEYGHLHPHLPLARALSDAGHDVCFAIPRAFCPRVEQAGFAALPVGLDRAEIADEVARRFPEWASVRDTDRLRFALSSVGAHISAPGMLPGLISAVRDRGADLLVHGPAVFAGPVAAAVAGIPSVNQSWGPLLPLGELGLATDAASGLWRSHGLEAPPLGGMFDHLYLDACPPSLQDGEVERLPARRLLRPVPTDPVGSERLPDWVAGLPPRPTVYITLGTFFNRFTKHFVSILEALADEPLNLIVTVGYDQDPAVLGPQPDHVRVERYIPLSLLLPHCDAMVTHGGSGSVLAALAFGVPLLVVPLGADQFGNAERCVASGAGRRLAAEDLLPGAVRAEVARLLDDPDLRRAAGRLREEIAAMPSPEQTVRSLEDVASGNAS